VLPGLEWTLNHWEGRSSAYPKLDLERGTTRAEPIRAAVRHGAYLIDTAESYGTEDVVGEAIQGRRAEVLLATKVSPRHFRRAELIAAAERSLRRLRTDYIDLYQLHWPNYTVPIGESMAAMEELVQAGKVRFIGVSNFSVRELKKAQAALTKNRIVSNQVRYSLIERTIEDELLRFCQRTGVTVIAYSPLGTTFSTLQACDPERVLAHIASATGKTEAQVALNWVVAPSNTGAIPKASNVAHVIDNCGASGWRLSSADYEFLATKIRCRSRGRIASAARRYVRNTLQLFGKM
jgi:diketogulonate reductase-like aldo/keto reductase